MQKPVGPGVFPTISTPIRWPEHSAKELLKSPTFIGLTNLPRTCRSSRLQHSPDPTEGPRETHKGCMRPASFNTHRLWVACVSQALFVVLTAQQGPWHLEPHGAVLKMREHFPPLAGAARDSLPFKRWNTERSHPLCQQPPHLEGLFTEGARKREPSG